MIKLIIFDLDGTLYSDQNALILETRRRAISKVSNVNNITYDEAEKIYMQLGDKYPNPYEGLASVGVSTIEYMSIFNSIEIEHYIKVNVKLKDLLKRLRCKKIVLTLSPYKYAKRVLDALDISELIDELICVGVEGDFKKDFYFERIKLKSGFHNVEICNIGNSLKNDIQAAGKFNFKNILITNNEGEYANTIHDILEIRNDKDIDKICRT